MALGRMGLEIGELTGRLTQLGLNSLGRYILQEIMNFEIESLEESGSNRSPWKRWGPFGPSPASVNKNKGPSSVLNVTKASARYPMTVSAEASRTDRPWITDQLAPEGKN